jgi:RHS repeat-associated protein
LRSLDEGNWILFNYETFEADDLDDRVYLSKVITPTHKATFSLADNRENEWTNYYRVGKPEMLVPNISNTRSLDGISLEINLPEIESKPPLKRIVLSHTFELAKLGKFFETTSYDGKLTLTGITEYGQDGSAKPGYIFDYHYNPDVQHIIRFFDGFGYYNNVGHPSYTSGFFQDVTNEVLGENWGINDTVFDPSSETYVDCEANFDGTAWSLTRIVYPTGGSEEYYYQNDVIQTPLIPIHLVNYDNNNGHYEYIMREIRFGGSDEEFCQNGDIRISGGARVTRILKREGPDSVSKLIGSRSFTYGHGRLNEVPSELLPYIRTVPIWYQSENANLSRGKLRVYYSSIVENVNNERKISREYATDFIHEDHIYGDIQPPSLVPINETMVFQRGYREFVLNDVKSHMWGQLLKESVSPFSSPGIFSEKEIEQLEISYRIMGNIFNTADLPNVNGFNLRQFIPRTTKVIQREKYEADAPWATAVVKTFEYHPHTMQLIKEKTETGNYIIEKYTDYAHDIYSGSGDSDWSFYDSDLQGPRQNNQLQGIARSYTRTQQYGPDGWENAVLTDLSVNVYALQEVGRQPWIPRKSYTLGSEDYLNAISDVVFDAWGIDETPDDPKWISGSFVESIDNYGQSKVIQNADGSRLKLFYGENDLPFAASNRYAGAYITGLVFEDVSASKRLERHINYIESSMQPEKIYDENNNYIKYYYDNFLRLKSVENMAGELLKEYEIYYARSNGGYSSTSLNYLQETIHLNEPLVKRVFIDGLSREIQTATLGHNQPVVYGALSLDGFGRTKKTFKNYTIEDISVPEDLVFDVDYALRYENGATLQTGEFVAVKTTNEDEWEHIADHYFKTFDLSDFPFDSIEVSWRTDFFNSRGSVRFYATTFAGEIISEEYQISDHHGTLNIIEQSLKIPVAGHDSLTFYLEIPEHDPLSITSKNYIFTTAHLAVPQFNTQIQYLANSDEVTKTIHPSHGGDRDFTKTSYTYVNSSDLEFPFLTDVIPANLGEQREFVMAIRYDNSSGMADTSIYYAAVDQQIEMEWDAYGFGGESPLGIIKVEKMVNGEFIELMSDQTSESTHREYSLDLEYGKTYRFVNYLAPCMDCFDGPGPDLVPRGNSDLTVHYTDLVQEIYPQLLRRIDYYDEVKNRRSEYFNVIGNKIADVSINKENLSQVITQYSYDTASNLTKVYHPNYFNPPFASEAGDWITEYKYNTLGQMLWKDTPDDGRTEYKYDKMGHLRFSQNAKQRLEGKVSFSSYDFAGRILKTGAGNADFSSLDPDAVNTALENDSNNWLALYHYDSAPDALVTDLFNDIKDNWVDPANYLTLWNELRGLMITGATYNNPKGHLTAAAAKSGDKWEIELYSYDNENRVDNKHILVQGLRDNAPADFDRTMINYSYNRQGMVTMRSVQFNNDSQFYHHFSYNGLMQLENVYTSRTPINPASPGQPDATYTYNVQGLVEKVHLHTEGSGFDMDYAYNLRDWVTGIGDVDNSSHAFWARYDYLANGNIATSEYFNKMSQEPHFKYDYTYDGLNRLTTAAYATFGGSSWTAKPDFGVSNLSYDDMGNILSLKRHSNSSSVADDLSYNYSHNNRLHSVSDGMGKTDSWDAQSGLYHYDALGNVTATWKQDDGSYQFMPMNAINLPEHFETANEADGYIEITGNAWVSGSRTGNLALTDNAQAKTTITFNDRGLNVITMSSDGQSVIDDRNFDMYNNGSSSKEGDALAAYLEALPASDHIIVIGLYDSGANAAYGEPQQEWTEAAYLAMEKLGAGRIRELKLRDGYVFAVTAGQPHTAMEDLQVYDAANNLTAPSLRYPVSIISKAHYRYNLAGQRIYKKVGNGKAEYYIMDGDVNLGVVDEDGVLQHWNIYGNDLLGRFERRSIYEPQPATDVIQQKDVAKDLGLTGKEEDTSWKIDGNSKDEKVTSLTTGTHAIEITGKDADGQTSTKTENVLVKPKMVDKKFWYLKDHLGSTRAVIDEENTIVETSDYYPFGLQMPGKKYLTNANTTKEGFTGKERDKESGSVYFGARNYDPTTGRFFGVDAFAEKYYSLNSYQYAANSPILLIDVNGDSLVLTGDQENIDEFINIANEALGGFYTATADASGLVTLTATDQHGPMTAKQNAFYQAIQAAADINSNMVAIGLVAGDNNVLVGSYETGQIDMDDVSAFGNGEFATSAGALGHEIAEQTEKQHMGLPSISQDGGQGYLHAHNNVAIPVENAINGTIRGNTITASNTLLEIEYQKGKIMGTVKISMNNGNITGVKQK